MKIPNLQRKIEEKRKTRFSYLLIILIFLILVNIISLMSLISAETYSATPYSYNIELYYDKGKIEIKSVNIEFSQAKVSNPQSENHLEIIDNKNNILERVYFIVPNFALIDIANESGDFVEGRSEFLENISFNVFVPYYENGYQIIVYDNKIRELDREFISQFSKTGFNKEDFRGVDKDKVSEKEIAKSEKDEDITARETANYKNYILILLIVLLVLIIFLIYLLTRKK